MNKAAKHRRTQRSRARAEKRQRARAAVKGAGPRAVSMIVPTDGSEPHHFDDCPICRAMKEVGATVRRDGVVMMTPAQEQAYQRKLDELAASGGWPGEAVVGTGEDLRRFYDEVNGLLEARGYPTDMGQMTADERATHLQRVVEVLRERERAEQVAAVGDLAS